MDLLDDDEELYEEESTEESEAYGNKKKLNEAVDNGDMDAEDALFMEGYLDDEEE
jgi:hypothetical protein